MKASSTPVSNKKKYSLRLKMTAEMSPEARVIVYYNNKEYLIFDDIELKFDEFNNEVCYYCCPGVNFKIDEVVFYSLQFKFFLDSKEYFPGQEVQIDVYAAKDSYIAFSGIDQSVFLVRNSPHDISRDDVLKELALYGATQPNEFDYFHVSWTIHNYGNTERNCIIIVPNRPVDYSCDLPPLLILVSIDKNLN